MRCDSMSRNDNSSEFGVAMVRRRVQHSTTATTMHVCTEPTRPVVSPSRATDDARATSPVSPPPSPPVEAIGNTSDVSLDQGIVVAKLEAERSRLHK